MRKRWLTWWPSMMVTVICASLVPRNSAAYNNPTHVRLVEASIEVMLSTEESPPSPPPGVGEVAWQTYLTRVRAAANRLSAIRTDLFGPYRGSSTLGAPPGLLGPVASFNDPEICRYHGSNGSNRDVNLLRTANVRIEDFSYYPSLSSISCGYERLDGIDDPPIGGSLGPVLGWHAQNVDNRINDSDLWLRPSNAAIMGLAKEVATRATEYAAGALLVPFVCLANLLTGHSCDVGDAFDLAEELDPVTLLEGEIPGVGSFRSVDYVGLWHFVDVDASIRRYNDTRGLFYENAGPSHPGAVDVAIMAAADLSGLSLNAYASEGPSRYGPYDRTYRTKGQWQSHTIAHTEFSPIQHLAREDWDAYVANPTSAGRLGGPLHAVGDAAEPHHVAGTTSWGHRPFEDAVEHMPDLLPRAVRKKASETTGTTNLLFAPFRDRVLRAAFDALRAFDETPSMPSFIEREARAARDLAHADGDWVFQDLSSVEYAAGAHGASARTFEHEPDRARPFVELGVAYAVALLTRAGDVAQDPGFDPATLCPEGNHFTGQEPGCAPGPASPAPVVEAPPFALVSCNGVGEACGTSADCCEGASCVAGTCRASGSCTSSGQPCQANVECCSSRCIDGVCELPVN